MRNYIIPLDINSLINNIDLEYSDVLNSIDKNIELILLTYYGEHYYSLDYGSPIFDILFDKNFIPSRSNARF